MNFLQRLRASRSVGVETSCAVSFYEWRQSGTETKEVLSEGVGVLVFRSFPHSNEGEGILLNDRMTSDKNCDHEPSTGRY
jgi:hypothetical protein